ncbi:TIR-like protein FxsC [Dactylosporangium sp. CA-092794]|uniref:TIR-like protein FxsC n=1 Tax=Dactylosporangium sp. CA-092794 TaxID=3239929 RepID=UPI003D93DFC9
MTEEWPEPAPGAPLFFLSYARSRRTAAGRGRDANRRVLDFYAELSEYVYELVALEPGCEPGFIDRSLDGGEEWAKELAFAVGHCQVFVPLLSERYLKSVWCAREWDAFTRREVLVNPKVPDAGNRTSVIPVIWNVIHDDTPIPERIAALQRFSPTGLPGQRIEARYKEEGMFGLIVIGNRRGDLSAATWRLAQRIVQARHERWIEPDVPADLRSLRSDFGGTT